MKFACPHCGQSLEAGNSLSGETLKCPSCNEEITVPAAAVPETPEERTITDSEASVSPPVEDEPRTITDAGVRPDGIMDAPRNGRVRGPADRESPEHLGHDPDTSKLLTADQEHKYEVGEVIAKGGMGAILDARDLNLRRGVAMKVLRDPEQARKQDVLRFIEEAQITSQLEHPSIVPIHELGVDASDNVFYTMKFVRGRTLQEIITGIAKGDEGTIDEYGLIRLLTVFQKACDAMAFAHSKRVIHRDLKPENIMVGEYGEVQVMDWGLAKVMPRKKRKKYIIKKKSVVSGQSSVAKKQESEGKDGSPPRHPTLDTPDDGVESVRTGETSEVWKTMSGAVMGTPRFMAPEQAAGDIEHLDEKTDIYALGAILYNVLTLHPPITGDKLDVVLKKVSTGDIPNPTTYGSRRRSPSRGQKSEVSGQKGAVVSLVHCPEGAVPQSLAAVTMKALSLKPADRYATVKALQTDVEAYLGGFVTSAESASAWKVVKLFVKRNKKAAVTAAAMAMVLFGAMGIYSWINYRERMRAERNLAAYEEEQARRQADRKASAPEMVRSSKLFIQQRDFKAALATADAAVEYDDTLADARFVRTLLRLRAEDYKDALEDCQAFAELMPGNKDAARLLNICEAAGRQGALPGAGLSSLVGRLGLPIMAAEFTSSSQEQFAIYRDRLAKAWPAIDMSLVFTKNTDGNLKLSLHGRQEVTDLSPLAGMPLAWLYLPGTSVTDLSPLKGMPLKFLSLSGCNGVTDLSPLSGMDLAYLTLPGGIKDLSPLHGMPLAGLDLTGCTGITDLSPLEGMRLLGLSLNGCTGITSLKPLRGMPLAPGAVTKAAGRIGTIEADIASWRTRSGLDIAGCTGLTSLEGLEGMKLKELNLYGMPKLRDISALKGMPLTFLNLRGCRAIRDVSPLAGMPLERLQMNTTKVTDLSPLKGTPLTHLWLPGHTEGGGIGDLEPLRGTPLEELHDLAGSALTSLEPLRGMPLKILRVHSSKNLKDISPLKGMPLTKLTMAITGVTNLAPLAGMKLQSLEIGTTPVNDLSPLKGMPLTSLALSGCEGVSDLGPLAGMPLKSLTIQAREGGDQTILSLVPLRGMPLNGLRVTRCKGISDLTPLRGMKLKTLWLQECTDMQSLAGLEGIPLAQLSLARSKGVTDLAPLAGMALTSLDIQATGVTDLTPLAGMDLHQLYFSPDNITKGMEVLRDMKSLQRISLPGFPLSAAEFFKRYDAGEFGPKR